MCACDLGSLELELVQAARTEEGHGVGDDPGVEQRALEIGRGPEAVLDGRRAEVDREALEALKLTPLLVRAHEGLQQVPLEAVYVRCPPLF